MIQVRRTFSNAIRNVLLLFTGVFLFSCDKYKGTDVYITGDVLVYAAPGNQGYNVLNGGNFAVLQSTVLPGANTSFPVMLSRAADKDVQVTGIIDTSMLAAYDSAYGTKALRFNTGAFKLNNDGVVTIKAGQTSSSDSIQIVLADTTGIKFSTPYVIPVRLSASSGNIPISASRKIMYVKTAIAKVFSAVSSGLLVVNGGYTVSDKRGPTVGFPATINVSVSKTITLSFTDDAGLVPAYNAANKTNYAAMPAGSYTMINNTVTIGAGATASSDSVKIGFSDLSAFTPGTSYLLPVRIKDESDVAPQAGNNVKYVILSAFLTNIDPSNSGLTGAIMNRTGWSVTASGSYSAYGVARILDGDNKSSWDSDGKLPAWVQLNMGSVKTVKGFRIVPNYDFTTDDFLNMEIFSSNDGNSWISEGKYAGTPVSGSSSAANPDIKTVRFFTPVTARYFKFNITKTTDGKYAGMGELNAIE
ncbi:MAG: DUF1735 domain-containing protein [Niabella sp.]|nr:DUF1735 domain-containing protein [Niabella sp.]